MEDDDLHTASLKCDIISKIFCAKLHKRRREPKDQGRSHVLGLHGHLILQNVCLMSLIGLETLPCNRKMMKYSKARGTWAREVGKPRKLQVKHKFPQDFFSFPFSTARFLGFPHISLDNATTSSPSPPSDILLAQPYPAALELHLPFHMCAQGKNIVYMYTYYKINTFVCIKLNEHSL